MALRAADEQVAAVSATDLSRPTPCAGWRLADLLSHMIGQHHGFEQAIWRGAAPVQAYAPVAFTLAGWRASVEELTGAIVGADLAQSVVAAELSAAAIPVSRVIDAHLLDTVVHTWDVAAARGDGYTPAGPLLAATAQLALTIPARARGPGGAFGHARPASGRGPWADTLAITGRRPGNEPMPPEE
jgi:uncharacterized protein (TIGR03086 family)